MTGEQRRRADNVTGNIHDGDRLMTMQEVADFLRLPLATCRKQRVEGKFVPGYRVGKFVRFRRSAVLQWLEEHADDV